MPLASTSLTRVVHPTAPALAALGGPGMRHCPVPEHDDRHPSLSVREKPDGTVLIHCHAGCSAEDVLAEKGLTFAALYPGGGNGRKAIPNLDGYLATAEKDTNLSESCRAVLREYVRLARRSGSYVVSPGDRDVAVRVGLSRATVQNARNKLRCLGYLAPAGGGRTAPKDAAEWRITGRAKPGHNSTPGTLLKHNRAREGSPKPEVASDIWRYQYLGNRAGAIFRYIARYSDREPDFEEVFNRVQAAKDPRTVKKHLAVLVAHGLIAETPRGFTLGPRSVEEVAESLGLAGNPVSAAQRRAHVAERAYFREAVAIAEARDRHERAVVAAYAVRGRTIAPDPHFWPWETPTPVLPTRLAVSSGATTSIHQTHHGTLRAPILQPNPSRTLQTRFHRTPSPRMYRPGDPRSRAEVTVWEP